MPLSVVGLEVLSALLLVVSGVLFLINGAKRRKLDWVLKQAAAPGNQNIAQLGLFGTWSPQSPVALAVPERRWIYDQSYMIAFIQAIRSQDIADTADASKDSAAPGSLALAYYAWPILVLDIGFAVSFAAFIACAAFLAAEWFAGWPWAARACAISGCLGVVYGAADVAEDIKLRSILAHARRVVDSKMTGESLVSGTALADAAEVDAANALTRVKLVAILASGIGVIAFLILVALDRIVVGISGGQAAGTRVPAHHTAPPTLGPATGA
jgi:hypothetical protein